MLYTDLALINLKRSNTPLRRIAMPPKQTGHPFGAAKTEALGGVVGETTTMRPGFWYGDAGNVVIDSVTLSFY